MKKVFRLLISISIIILIIVSLYFVFDYFSLLGLTKEELQDKVLSSGIFAPFVFIILCFLQVTFIPLPSTVVIIGGSYIFGWFLCFVYSLIGILLGSFFAFFLGRFFGKKLIYFFLGDNLDLYLKKIKDKEKIVLFLMFLFPFFPDDILCLVSGVSSISFKWFFLVQIITRIISILTTLIILSGSFIPYSNWFLILMLCIIGFVLFFVSYIILLKKKKL